MCAPLWQRFCLSCSESIIIYRWTIILYCSRLTTSTDWLTIILSWGFEKIDKSISKSSNAYCSFSPFVIKIKVCQGITFLGCFEPSKHQTKQTFSVCQQNHVVRHDVIINMTSYRPKRNAVCIKKKLSIHKECNVLVFERICLINIVVTYNRYVV